jgi:hypothetical protein
MILSATKLRLPMKGPVSEIHSRLWLERCPFRGPLANWWSQFVQGDGSRQIEKQTAIEVCRIIMREALGLLKAQRIPVVFGNELVTLRDLQSKVQDLAGPKGWNALFRKAGQR